VTKHIHFVEAIARNAHQEIRVVETKIAKATNANAALPASSFTPTEHSCGSFGREKAICGFVERVPDAAARS